LSATPYVWTAPENIARREFLYGRRLIRKYATATIAPGGVGKTALEVAEVLSMVSGKALLGAQTPQLRVWLWSLEDPREEMVRRIQAAAKHYNLTREDIGNRLFLDSGREQPLVIAETQHSGAVIYWPVLESIVGQLKERAIDVLIIDPFVSCHRVTENDNNAIDAVTKAWASVAHAANCAIELVHHVRKGDQEITVESARGGGSFGDACRMVRVINRMTKEDAQKAGVDNHRLYFRTYIDKNNLAPPADKSDWYQLVSVDLGNGPLGPVVGGGDSIGVVTKWEWPDPLEGVTGRDFERIATEIRAGEWRESAQATKWVGVPVAKALGLKLTLKQHRARVTQLIRTWLGTGALVKVEKLDDRRKKKVFVEVADDD
jgi:AAA domain